jgi:transcriptional regulator with XRE-family HTH domain
VISIVELKRRFRLLRKKRNLTQQAFAAKAALDYKFYQYLESPRKKQIWLETVDRIASAHRMEAWQLLHPNFLGYCKVKVAGKKSTRRRK